MNLQQIKDTIRIQNPTWERQRVDAAAARVVREGTVERIVDAVRTEAPKVDVEAARKLAEKLVDSGAVSVSTSGQLVPVDVDAIVRVSPDLGRAIGKRMAPIDQNATFDQKAEHAYRRSTLLGGRINGEHELFLAPDNQITRELDESRKEAGLYQRGDVIASDGDVVDDGERAGERTFDQKLDATMAQLAKLGL